MPNDAPLADEQESYCALENFREQISGIGARTREPPRLGDEEIGRQRAAGRRRGFVRRPEPVGNRGAAVLEADPK